MPTNESVQLFRAICHLLPLLLQTPLAGPTIATRLLCLLSLVTEAPRHLSTWHLDSASDGRFYSKDGPPPFLPCLPLFPDRNHDGDNQSSRTIFQKQLISKNQHCSWVLGTALEGSSTGNAKHKSWTSGTQTCKHANTS